MAATVLVVDDDPHIREVVRFALDKSGFATLEAGDGRAALSALTLPKKSRRAASCTASMSSSVNPPRRRPISLTARIRLSVVFMNGGMS